MSQAEVKSLLTKYSSELDVNKLIPSLIGCGSLRCNSLTLEILHSVSLLKNPSSSLFLTGVILCLANFASNALHLTLFPILMSLFLKDTVEPNRCYVGNNKVPFTCKDKEQ